MEEEFADIAEVSEAYTGTVLPRCYALLTVTPPPLPPPASPTFGRNYCIGLFYFHYTPPRATRAGLQYCSSCTCTRVASVEELYSCNIKCVENSLRTGLGLFTDLRRFPEHEASDSSCDPTVLSRGRLEESGCEIPAMFCKKWQHVRGQQLFHPSVLPRHVD